MDSSILVSANPALLRFIAFGIRNKAGSCGDVTNVICRIVFLTPMSLSTHLSGSRTPPLVVLDSCTIESRKCGLAFYYLQSSAGLEAPKLCSKALPSGACLSRDRTSVQSLLNRTLLPYQVVQIQARGTQSLSELTTNPVITFMYRCSFLKVHARIQHTCGRQNALCVLVESYRLTCSSRRGCAQT